MAVELLACGFLGFVKGSTRRPALQDAAVCTEGLHVAGLVEEPEAMPFVT